MTNTSPEAQRPAEEDVTSSAKPGKTFRCGNISADVKDVKTVVDRLRRFIDELPPELSTDEAAKILAVSKDTVLRLKRAGLLEFRNTAPPESARPVYRYTLASVAKLRTTYTRDVPALPTPRKQNHHHARRKPKTTHIRIQDD
jgi:predicted transcriptional regulator